MKVACSTCSPDNLTKFFFLENYHTSVCNKSTSCIFVTQNVKMMWTQMLTYKYNTNDFYCLIKLILKWNQHFVLLRVCGGEKLVQSVIMPCFRLGHQQFYPPLHLHHQRNVNLYKKDKQHLSVIMKIVLTSLTF